MNVFEVLLIGLLALALGMGVTYVTVRRPMVRVSKRETNLEEVIGELTEKLAEANRKIGRLEARIIELEKTLARQEIRQTGSDTLLVAVGTDPMLKVDLSALRAVESRTPLKILRLLPVTKDNFRRIIDQRRSVGQPIRRVHIATHASRDGVEFGDGVADGIWLSAQLGGVEVLLLAGCETSQVGDYLGLVPFLVTTLESLSQEDAMRMAGVFWQAVGEWLLPAQVEARCRERLPAELLEAVEFRY